MASPSPLPASAPRSPGSSSIENARRRGSERRQALDGEQRASATRQAVVRLLDLPELAAPGPGGVVAASVAVRGELDVAQAFGVLRARGWRLALPVVGADATMAFRFHEPGDVLAPGRFGIPEPPRLERADGAGSDLDPTDLDATDLDVVIAPCVAVDEVGTRVGFGAGFYDRALAEADRRPTVVVVAFEVQVESSALPAQPWDVPADVVVTDRRTIRRSVTAARRGRGHADDGSGDAPAR